MTHGLARRDVRCGPYGGAFVRVKDETTRPVHAVLARLRRNSRAALGRDVAARPGSLPGLRQRNRQQVLEVVRDRGTTSRSDIARRTGLSPTTVSTLVGQLLAQAVVVELRRHDQPGRGWPAGATDRAQPAPPAAWWASTSAHDHVRVARHRPRRHGARRDRHRARRRPPAGRHHGLRRRRDPALVAASGLPPEGVVGVGIAVSAPVSARHARHRLGRHPAGLAPGRPRRRDRPATGLPVEIGNDANLGAVAEHRFGVAPRRRRLRLRHGLRRRRRRARCSTAGSTRAPSAPPASSATSRWHPVASSAAAATGAAWRPSRAPAGSAPRSPSRTAGTPRSPAILAADAAGDERARRVLSDAGSRRGSRPRAAVHRPRPRAGRPRRRLRDQPDPGRRRPAALAASTTPFRRQPVPVRAGALGDRAEMLGAVALVTQRRSLV